MYVFLVVMQIEEDVDAEELCKQYLLYRYKANCCMTLKLILFTQLIIP